MWIHQPIDSHEHHRPADSSYERSRARPSTPRADAGDVSPGIHAIARKGIEGVGRPLPHLEVIQRAFGRHDVGHVRAHEGGAARSASRAMGARAYAIGSQVAFGETDLRTVAHEAAHVIQQANGVRLRDGTGRPGDGYERHADAVADAVVRGRSAEGLLDRAPVGGRGPVRHAGVQMDFLSILANQASRGLDEISTWTPRLATPVEVLGLLKPGNDRPNTWSNVVVDNKLDSAISWLRIIHRYDDDHFDDMKPISVSAGSKAEKDDEGKPLSAGYWTGLGRIGMDYWRADVSTAGERMLTATELALQLKSGNKDAAVVIEFRMMDEGGRRALAMRIKHGSSASGDMPLVSESERRPVYLIAHHCNKTDDISIALGNGANTIECDVRYHDGVWYAEHNDVVDASSLMLSDWLWHARAVAESFGELFALIYLDIKTPRAPEEHGGGSYLDSLMSIVHTSFPSSVGMNILYSTASYEDRGAFEPIREKLGGREGVAIDEHRDPDAVSKWYQEKEFSRAWYGSGIGAFIPDPQEHPLAWGTTVEESIEQGVAKRGADTFQKVATWTLVNPASVADYVANKGVDAVMVERHAVVDARNVLDSIGKVRLAGRSDNAFEAF